MEEIKKGFKKTKIGLIPKDWEVKRLGEIGKFFSGGTPSTSKKEYYQNGNIPFITSSDLNQRFIRKISKYITLKGLNNSSAKIVKKNHLLFALYGATAGLIAITKIEGAINQAILAMNFNKSNELFLFYWFEFNKNKIVFRFTQGGQPNLSAIIIKNLIIPLPPLKEQEKIAKILSTWDRAIEKQEELIKAKERLKKGLMQKLLTGKVRFKGFNEEWEEKKIMELKIYISDGNYGELYPTSEEFVKKGIPFIRANNIKNLKIVNEDMKYISKEKHKILNQGHLRENDILITTRGEIGNVAYVDKSFINSNINAQICLLRNKCLNIYSKYLLYYFVFNKKQFLKFQTGSVLKQLPKKSLNNIKIKLPPLAEQQKIAKVLSMADREIELLKEELELLKKQKRGLMQRLLSGRVRVRV